MRAGLFLPVFFVAGQTSPATPKSRRADTMVTTTPARTSSNVIDMRMKNVEVAKFGKSRNWIRQTMNRIIELAVQPAQNWR